MYRRTVTFFTHAVLMALSLACLVPLAAMLITSFKVHGGSLGLSSLNPFGEQYTFNNYVKIWKEGNFERYFFNSVMVTFFITVGNVLFDSMAAYALARRKFVGQKAVLGIIVAKLMIPSAVLMVPTFILVREIGLYNSYPAIILPMIAETFGIFLIRQYMLALPYEIEEAARLEGAGDFKIFFELIMPLCKPVLAVVGIHSFMTGWNMYIYPLILTSKDSLRTLPLGIAFYSSSNAEADVSLIMASSAVSALPVILIFILFQKQIISGLTSGAVKG